MVANWVALGVFIGLVAIAAAFGAVFEPGPWYEDLRKPPLNPPNWIFGPVWSILYLAMAIAGWLVWRVRPDSRGPLMLWGGQLVLNAIWSLLFFGLQRPGWALVEILVLLVVLIVTTVSFHRAQTAAAYLLVPYVAWVAFATYLNAGIWVLNR